MVLVRFGWIHTKFCSFALVVWHRLQQRKLILAKNETHKKTKTQSKHRIAKNNPTRFTRKKQNKKNRKTAKSINQNLEFDKFWLFCVFLVCFFLCALVLYVLKPCILYAVRLFRLNKRGVWPKKAFGRTATGKFKHVLFFSSATWVSRKHEKYKTKGAVEFQLTYEYPKIDTRT